MDTRSAVYKVYAPFPPVRRMPGAFMLVAGLCLCGAAHSQACTVFSHAKDGTVLAGRNWDMTDSAVGVPVMWVVPAQGSVHGRICFGRHDDCEDGMNDQGLFVAVAATPPSGRFKSRQDPVSCPVALDQLLAHCTSVDEAVAWWERHTNPVINGIITRRVILGIKSAYKNSGVGGHILITDKSGDSVVCEWDRGKLIVIRKTGSYQLITNFLLSKPDVGDAACPRFAAASKILDEAERPSAATCSAALLATCRDLTRYSVVYDLVGGNLQICGRGRFENCRRVNLTAELQKGAHEVKLYEWLGARLEDSAGKRQR